MSNIYIYIYIQRKNIFIFYYTMMDNFPLSGKGIPIFIPPSCRILVRVENLLMTSLSLMNSSKVRRFKSLTLLLVLRSFVLISWPHFSLKKGLWVVVFYSCIWCNIFTSNVLNSAPGHGKLWCFVTDCFLLHKWHSLTLPLE